MKRDDEYIRDLLLQIEASSKERILHPEYHPMPPGYARKVHHAHLLCDACLLCEVAPGEFRMTSQGHDFLAVVRDEDTWAEAKGLAELLGGVPLRMLRDLAIDAHHRNVMSLTGG
jgi:hypothetical protein